jgi:hypothetical protein
LTSRTDCTRLMIMGISVRVSDNVRNIIKGMRNMESWATQELRYADSGDARLNKRLAKIVEDLAGQPESSVPEACGDWASTKGAYRFWDNPNVEPCSVLSTHEQSTVDRLPWWLSGAQR